MTRRTLVGSLAATTLLRAADAPRRAWRPKLGVLCRYTAANLEFAKQQGFSNAILDAGENSNFANTPVETLKQAIANSGLSVSALQITVNHTDPDPAKRDQINKYFAASIERAGQLGIPYIGSASGKNPNLSFPQQVDEIVRIYESKYFAACERNHVRILWEPWPDGPNIATSPVGYEALFKAFDNSQYVGLQIDPSHFVRQFMDPIQITHDFVDKIYDVHLKDTEILWPVLRAGGIHPVNQAKWWRYRIPGMGSINWREFFNILESVGYAGAMSIEQEDPLYGADHNPGPDFSDDFKLGFIMAKRYLAQYVP